MVATGLVLSATLCLCLSARIPHGIPNLSLRPNFGFSKRFGESKRTSEECKKPYMASVCYECAKRLPDFYTEVKNACCDGEPEIRNMCENWYVVSPKRGGMWMS